MIDLLTAHCSSLNEQLQHRYPQQQPPQSDWCGSPSGRPWEPWGSPTFPGPGQGRTAAARTEAGKRKEWQRGFFFLNVKNSNDGMFRSHSPAGTTVNSLQPEWDGPSQRRRRPVSVPEGGRKVPTVQEGGERRGRGWVTTLILSYHDGTGKLYINNILALLSS